jgi:3,4-dihydroxy 2-butanone 4-phosphate synthase/GTP cyclohydrolase II
VVVTVLPSRDKEGDKDKQIVVVTVGQRSTEPIVRVQSRCYYGETLGSLDCDCGAQLETALHRMKAAGSGILIHLDQEGRGEGLRMKALAYEMAERNGWDPFNAYTELGLEHDRRSYVDAVWVLQLLDVDRCVLLTNNRFKIRALEEASIMTRREALWVHEGDHLHGSPEAMQQGGYLR